MDILDGIIAWEDGTMSDEEEVPFFQALINSGMAWTLQGMYGRRANELIKEGLCTYWQGGEP
jgi:hypothetical protein